MDKMTTKSAVSALFTHNGVQKATEEPLSLDKPLDEVFTKEPGLLSRSFYSVEEPHILGTMIPRDLKATKTNQSGMTQGVTNPTKVMYQSFDCLEDATRWAQRQNKPLVIVEHKPCAKVIPVLPMVEKI